MELVIKSRGEEALEDYDYRDCVEYDVDGLVLLTFHDGEPEDNTLSRNFSSVYSIESLVQIAYEAGLRGDPLNITYQDLEE